MLPRLIGGKAVVADVLLGRVQTFLLRFCLEVLVVIVWLVHLSL